MKREEKAALVVGLHERLQSTNLAIMTEYRGLTVAQMNRLRRELKAVDASYRVSKNTLTRLAIKETRFGTLETLMRGPTGLVTSAKDPVTVAKILVRFAEQNDKLKITGGVLDGEALPAEGVSALAKLPSREVLLAQLLGLIQAPASQLLRTMQEPGAMLVRLLGALERSKGEAESGPSEQHAEADGLLGASENHEGGAAS